MNDYYNHEHYPDPTAYTAVKRIEAEQHRNRYRPIVFICSPYAGNTEENINAARRYSRFAVESGYIPVAPHLLYPQFLDDAVEDERQLGLAVIGKVYVEALIIAYGGGQNGKSTFWNTISRVLGTYSGSMSADALTVGCKRNVKPELAEVKGKRFIIAAELEEGNRLNTSIIKQLCSTDRIFAEKKYKDPFSFIPTHTLVLYTNHLPRVGASDVGTWRRLIVIPFNAKIESKDDKKNFSDFLFENAGEYVLKWVIDGAKIIIDRDFKIPMPSCVYDAISAYRAENDWLAHFLDDCCEVERSFTQKSGELYQEYRAYCQRTGEYTRSTSDFYAALSSCGFERRKTNKCNLITGLRLKSDFLAE